MLRRILPCLLVIGASQGCVERPRDLTRAERRQLEPYVTTTAPRPRHPLSIRFGDDVELVGYDVDDTRWNPGATLTVTFYWHVLRDLDEGLRAFTHVCDETGHMHLGADDEGLVRRLYPAGLWRAGEYVRDVQTILLPGNYDHDEVTVYVGLYVAGERLPITRGPNDGQQRARVVTLPSSGTPQPNPGSDLPRIVAKRTTTPISLDGLLNEPGWAAAQGTSPFVETIAGVPSGLHANVRVLWDDTQIYFAWEVEDGYLSSPFTEADDHLWEKDCVEIMLDPGGDGLNYFEMQVNPLGTTFDTRYDSRRVPQPFGHVDFDAHMRVGTKVRGTTNDSLDDEGYTVEIAVPFTALAVGEPPTTPPQGGTVWRANFYVMDTMRQGGRASGWSAPRVGDFHMPPRFGEILFEVNP